MEGRGTRKRCWPQPPPCPPTRPSAATTRVQERYQRLRVGVEAEKQKGQWPSLLPNRGGPRGEIFERSTRIATRSRRRERRRMRGKGAVIWGGFREGPPRLFSGGCFPFAPVFGLEGDTQGNGGGLSGGWTTPFPSRIRLQVALPYHSKPRARPRSRRSKAFEPLKRGWPM